MPYNLLLKKIIPFFSLLLFLIPQLVLANCFWIPNNQSCSDYKLENPKQVDAKNCSRTMPNGQQSGSKNDFVCCCGVAKPGCCQDILESKVVSSRYECNKWKPMATFVPKGSTESEKKQYESCVAYAKTSAKIVENLKKPEGSNITDPNFTGFSDLVTGKTSEGNSLENMGVISGSSATIQPEANATYADGSLLDQNENPSKTSAPVNNERIGLRFWPQIPIPGLQLSQSDQGAGYQEENGELYYEFADKGDVNMNLSPITLYFRTLYNYGVGIIGVLATVVLMIGGIIWITAGGNNTNIDKAKGFISASVAGMVIALSSYLIMHTLDPTLVNVVDRDYEYDIGGDLPEDLSQSSGSAKMHTQKATAKKNINIYCPDSGGYSKVRNIAESFDGKTVYRLGGKIYTQHYTYFENEKGKKCGSVDCSGFNPSDKLVLDCSGYTNWVLKCAGLKQIPGECSTNEFVQKAGAEKVNNITTKNGELVINGIQATPGDVFVFKGAKFGHVLMYVGNNQLMHSSSRGRVGDSVYTDTADKYLIGVKKNNLVVGRQSQKNYSKCVK